MAEPAGSAQKPTPPSIELVISSDKLSAAINIIPTSNQNANLTPDELFKILNSNHIIFGVDETKIRHIVQKYNANKGRVENEEVAHGKYPKPGKKGEMRTMAPGITDKAVLDQLLKESPEPHISDVLKLASKVKRVNAGETFARRGAPKKGIPGEDIYGTPVESKDLAEGDETFGPNVEVVENGEAIHAKVTGIPCHFDNKIDVIPADFNARFKVEISADRMEARASLLPAGEGGHQIDASTITAVLHDKKIQFGIDQPLLQATANKVNAEKSPIENLLIAKGQPAIHGNNGRIEYFFHAEGSLKPKEMEDGSVNFKEISLIETVGENQELARLYPPTKGQPGYDVLGNIIQARDGAALSLPTGANTGPHPSNPDVLISIKGGNVRLSGKLVEVSEGFNIPGDVDFSTGNVDYKRSVTIKGDVKNGFTVNVGGDLDIGGLVEDSTIKAEGNVLVRGGFIGIGKGEIVANGSVNVGFIRNQTIKSRNSVVVAKEAMNAKIFARNSVAIHGRTLSAVGGKISARNEIEGYVFGNDQGTKTELEVGLDFTLVEEKYKSEDKMRELNDNKKKVQENLSKFEKIKKIKKALPPKQEFLYKKLLALMGKIDSQLTALEKRKEMIDKKILEIGKAKIIVKDRMMPGVLIKIGERHLAVQQQVIGPKSVMLVDGEIKFL